MNQLLIVVLMAIFVNVNGNMKKKKSPPQKIVNSTQDLSCKKLLLLNKYFMWAWDIASPTINYNILAYNWYSLFETLIKY